MPDNLTPEQRRRAMSNVKSKDTDLEVKVRSALHRRGYRFRKHIRSLPGNPDIVFTKAGVVVFVDGDLWHGYDFENLKKKLSLLWQEKILKNIARDERNFATLREMGWTVVRVWQHEIKKDLNGVVNRIAETVEDARKAQ